MSKKKHCPDFVVESLSELLERAMEIEKRAGEIWFRGQREESWELKPKVFRMHSPEFEKNVGVHFRLRAPGRHQDCPADQDFGGWLCLMQHYGVPTRLLDWTTSLLVATFFAVEGKSGKEDSVVWVLQPYILNQAMGKLNGLFTFESALPELLHLTQAAFFDLEELHTVLAVLPHYRDPRQEAQHSVFTIHGDSTELNCLHSTTNHALTKLIIPNSAREDFQNALRIMGVSRSSLFPDLENLVYGAIESAERHFPPMENTSSNSSNDGTK